MARIPDDDVPVVHLTGEISRPQDVVDVAPAYAVPRDVFLVLI